MLQPQAQIDPAALQGMVTASAASVGLSVERLDNEGGRRRPCSRRHSPAAALAGAANGQGVQVAEAGHRQVDGRVSALEPAGRVSGPWLGPAWPWRRPWRQAIAGNFKKIQSGH